MDWIGKPRLHSSHPGIWDSRISSLPRLSRWLRIPHLALAFLLTLLESRNWMTSGVYQSSNPKGSTLETIKASRADPSTFDRIFSTWLSSPYMYRIPYAGDFHVPPLRLWDDRSNFPLQGCVPPDYPRAKRKRNPEVDREQCIDENSANLVRLTRHKVRVVCNSFGHCAATCQGGCRLFLHRK